MASVFGTSVSSGNDRTAWNQNKRTTKSAEDFIFFFGCDSRLPKHGDLIAQTLTIPTFELQHARRCPDLEQTAKHG
ncbi:MAG: hypothetical protein ABGZ35_03635 [Planctomycetaceae bacterium]